MDLLFVLAVFIWLALLGFVIYFVFKQLQFVVQAVNLYKDMVRRLDKIIDLLSAGGPAHNQGDRVAQLTQLSDSSLDLGSAQKQCPVCAEHIKLEALKCRHCGKVFDPGAVRTETEQRKAELDQRKAELEQNKATMLKLVDGEIYYSEGWWRKPPVGKPVGPFDTREQAATRLQP